MITKDALKRFHTASRAVELDGPDCFFSLAARYGVDIAGALTVYFLRRCYGAGETVEPFAKESTVNQVLKEKHILVNGFNDPQMYPGRRVKVRGRMAKIIEMRWDASGVHYDINFDDDAEQRKHQIQRDEMELM